MSDTPTPIPTPGDVAPPAQATDAPEPEQKVDEIDWKAKAREWEKRAKDNKSAADRLAELEEANKRIAVAISRIENGSDYNLGDAVYRLLTGQA